jgi:dinuclear metal center YbgI/SA1388 family protein
MIVHMPQLQQIVEYCQKRLRVDEIHDFKGSANGLQVANDGRVTRIGAIVDAGLVPFREAAERKIDLLICHHGLYWDPPFPVVGAARDKLKILLDNNIALYSCHLPLDAHQQIGNNAIIAQKLGLDIERWGLVYEGTPMAPVCKCTATREELCEKLESIFPRVTKLAFGGESPKKLCIVSGSGNLTLHELQAEGVDTLITGELKQASFNAAQELGLNVFACGHYDTEVFGVRALAEELAQKYGVGWEFIPTGCPL